MKQLESPSRHPRRLSSRRLVIALPALVVLLTAVGLLAVHHHSGATSRIAPFATRRLNLNSASVDELQLLPGVGPAIAGRIVENRTTFGDFATLDRLTRVPGVGERTILKLAPYVTTSSPSANQSDDPPMNPGVH